MLHGWYSDHDCPLNHLQNRAPTCSTWLVSANGASAHSLTPRRLVLREQLELQELSADDVGRRHFANQDVFATYQVLVVTWMRGASTQHRYPTQGAMVMATELRVAVRRGSGGGQEEVSDK